MLYFGKLKYLYFYGHVVLNGKDKEKKMIVIIKYCDVKKESREFIFKKIKCS